MFSALEPDATELSFDKVKTEKQKEKRKNSSLITGNGSPLGLEENGNK